MSEIFKFVFDPNRTLRYHYSKLDEDKRIVYHIIYDAVQSYSPAVTIPGLTKYDIKELFDIYYSVKLDNPKIFWLSGLLNTTISQNSTLLEFTYEYSRTEIDELKKRLDYSLNSFVSKITGYNQSAYDVELAVHDLLSERILYDTSDNDAHCIVGPMLHKKGVCEGIALAFKYILDSIGIECTTIQGNLIENQNIGHLWNIVKLNNETYHVDVTNDLRIKNNVISHKYLNVPDSILKNTHIWPPTIKCDSIRDYYFEKNGLNFRNLKDAEKYLRNNDHKDFVEIRIDNVFDSNAVMRMLSNVHSNATVHFAKNCDVYIIKYNNPATKLKKIMKQIV